MSVLGSGVSGFECRVSFKGLGSRVYGLELGVKVRRYLRDRSRVLCAGLGVGGGPSKPVAHKRKQSPVVAAFH